MLVPFGQSTEIGCFDLSQLTVPGTQADQSFAFVSSFPLAICCCKSIHTRLWQSNEDKLGVGGPGARPGLDSVA